MGVTLVAFTNCSKNKHTPLFDPNSAMNVVEDVQPESLKLASSDQLMNCDEDHVQLGGICHPGDSVGNYIEVSLTRDRNPVPFGSGSSQTYKLQTTRCENGRFFIVLPRPNDPGATCTGGNCAPEYRVETQIWLTDDGSQYRAGARGTSFPVRIQNVSLCTGT